MYPSSWTILGAISPSLKITMPAPSCTPIAPALVPALVPSHNIYNCLINHPIIVTVSHTLFSIT